MGSAWQGSDRRRRLPRDWPLIRRRILERDGYQCTWTDQGKRCPEPATDVDHRHRGDDHSDANLRSLCSWHHARKSGREGNAARRPVITARRPAERHPGLRP